MILNVILHFFYSLISFIIMCNHETGVAHKSASTYFQWSIFIEWLFYIPHTGEQYGKLEIVSSALVSLTSTFLNSPETARDIVSQEINPRKSFKLLTRLNL